MNMLLRFCLIALVLAVALTTGASAVPRFTVQAIGTAEFYGRAINNSGQVAGSIFYADDSDGAGYWDGAALHDLGKFGYRRAIPTDVNDSGQMVVTLSPESREERAIITSSGGFTLIPSFVGRHMNNSGWVAGSDYLHASVFNGVSVSHLNPDGGIGNAVSDVGNVAGVFCPTGSLDQHACLWNGTGRLDLGPSGVDSTANDINNKDQVVVVVMPEGGRHTSYVWENGVLSSIGTLGVGYEDACAINEKGQVVGRAPYSAFFSENGVMYDLNTLTTDGGWKIDIANDINDSGQILCSGWSSAGKSTLILTPVPEPGSCATLMSGLVFAACVLKRKRG